MSADDNTLTASWLSLSQAAAYAGVAESQVTRARRSGAIGAVRLGYRTFVYTRDDLDQWLGAQYVPAAQPIKKVEDDVTRLAPLPAKRPRAPRAA